MSSALIGASPYRISVNGPSMMRSGGSTRRFGMLLIIAACVISILYLSNLRDPDHTSPRARVDVKKEGQSPATALGTPQIDLTGHVIPPKLDNATLKAELGRAAWKLLHTTFARFPDNPTPEESEALRTYVHLFQRLYPCGECAEHFSYVLKKYPPQVSSRSAAAAWGCHVHNIVNKRLHKEEFDCSKIGDFYDCGCADDEKIKEEEKASASDKEARSVGTVEEQEGKSEKVARRPLEIERMGPTQGG